MAAIIVTTRATIMVNIMTTAVANIMTPIMNTYRGNQLRWIDDGHLWRRETKTLWYTIGWRKTPWFWRVIRSRNQTLLAFYKILPLCVEVQESCCNLRYDRMLKYSVRSRLMGRPSENKETHCYRGMPSVQLVAIQPVQPSHTSQIVDSAQHFNFWNTFLGKNKNEKKNTPLNLRIYFVAILILKILS